MNIKGIDLRVPVPGLWKRVVLLASMMFVAFFMAGCLHDKKKSAAPVVPVSIQVTPANASIADGTTQQFTATVNLSNNTTEDVTNVVVWSSNNTAAATIGSATGLAAGTGPGTTVITATLGTVLGTANLTVTDATLVSIQVTPASRSIAKGTTQQFTATGAYTDSTTQNLTTLVVWSSNNELAATIGSATGLATAEDEGSATITATLGVVSATAALTVTSATLVSIQVTPATPSIAKGTTQQFTATGIYSDLTTQDLTVSASWVSDDLAVATVDSNGLATAVDEGFATITATVGEISDTADLTVTAAALVSIDVSPATASIAKGTTQQFTATGTYTDDSTQDLTSIASWIAAGEGDTGTATISEAGLATGTGAGSVTLTATVDGISGTAALTVTAAELVSIAVTPATASIATGTTQQFTATGTYTDASTQDLTAQVSWIAAGEGDTGTVTISSTGLATGTAVGSVTIGATLGSISNTAALTVTAATLVSIAVTPATPSIAIGSTQQFTATGTYTDASTQNLTSTVSWTSSDIGIATISSPGGLATSVAAGTVTITATSSGISGTASLTVSPTVIASMPFNGRITGGAGSHYYQYTTVGTVGTVTLNGFTKNMNPVIYSSADFTTVSSNWNCTAATGDATADTCTAVSAASGGTVLYIKAVKPAAGTTDFTLSVAQ